MRGFVARRNSRRRHYTLQILLIVQIGPHNDPKYELNLDCHNVRRRSYRSADRLTIPTN